VISALALLEVLTVVIGGATVTVVVLAILGRLE
jgi:hypothetical protein